MKKLKKLNIGCGTDIREGWTNVDKMNIKGVDLVMNLDKYPYPDFNDNDKYYIENNKVYKKLIKASYKFNYPIMTSRGCPFSCTYCCNSAFRKYIKQPKKKIIGKFLLEILYGKGKYSQKYEEGTNIIHLAPDVASVFHDDESVNNALRILIEIAKKQVDQYNL